MGGPPFLGPGASRKVLFWPLESAIVAQSQFNLIRAQACSLEGPCLKSLGDVIRALIQECQHVTAAKLQYRAHRNGVRVAVSSLPAYNHLAALIEPRGVVVLQWVLKLPQRTRHYLNTPNLLG